MIGALRVNNLVCKISDLKINVISFIINRLIVELFFHFKLSHISCSNIIKPRRLKLWVPCEGISSCSLLPTLLEYVRDSRGIYYWFFVCHSTFTISTLRTPVKSFTNLSGNLSMLTNGFVNPMITPKSTKT